MAHSVSILAASTQKPKKPKKGVNHAGRKLKELKDFTKPVIFNTKEADKIMSSLQIMPYNHAVNLDVINYPVHKDSDSIIKFIGTDGSVGINWDMNYIIVPPKQRKVDVALQYKDESDKGPFPVPDNAPIEGWPMNKADLMKQQMSGEGDRHLLIIDPHKKAIYELYRAFKKGATWQAACAATWALDSNEGRTAGWTSADAAGLPILPFVVRYDELERGEVEHALRFTVRQTAKRYIPPANHQAGRSNDPFAPPMGLRVRLKKDVDIKGFHPHTQAIAKAMKKYGMIVADNGTSWRFSCAPDMRISEKVIHEVKKLRGSDFEVVRTEKKIK